jgi:WD40 repeat protein
MSGSAGATSALQAFKFDDFLLTPIGSSYPSYAAESTVALNVGGNQVAIIGNNTTLITTGTEVEVLDFDGTTGYTFFSKKIIGPGGGLRAVSWDRFDGRVIVGGDTFLDFGSPAEVKEFSFGGFSPEAIGAHGATIRSVSHSLQADKVVIAGDTGTGGHQIRISDVTGGSYPGGPGFEFDITHGAPVYVARFSPTAQYLAIGGETSGGFEIRVYLDTRPGGVSSFSLVTSVAHGATVRAMSWDLSGKFLLIGGDIAGDGKDIRL